MATTSAGTNGGLASYEPRDGAKRKKDPMEPKGASTSKKAEQKGSERAFSECQRRKRG